jgi:hypothetical protein
MKRCTRMYKILSHEDSFLYAHKSANLASPGIVSLAVAASVFFSYTDGSPRLVVLETFVHYKFWSVSFKWPI